MLIIRLLSAFLVIAACVGQSFYDFTASTLDGEVISLSKYKEAKAILIVNVASRCTNARIHFIELTNIYSRLQSQGLEILAFPCNQFGSKEPGDHSEIREAIANYNIKFPVFNKILVNGPKADPIYKYLKQQTDKLEIVWNFHTFLVVNGKPVKRYSSQVLPSSIEPTIMKYLKPDEIASTRSDEL